MFYRINIKDLIFLSGLFFTGCSTHNYYGRTQSVSNILYGFNHPQDSARTKVWWFHGETETTREGITADLEAFKRAGVGGVVYYDQSHGKAENALPGFSPEWWKMLRFAAEEAKRLGLSFELHLSNGYVAGGPWITNETGMKRLVSTETFLKGKVHYSGCLEEPVTPFNFYRDVAIIAFPVQAGVGTNSLSTNVKISTNVRGLDATKIFDPQNNILTKVERNKERVYINLDFRKPFEAKSITYQMQPRGQARTSATNVPGPPSETFVGTGYRVLPDVGQLEASEDGIHYIKVCDLKPIYRAHERWRQKTISFNPVKARYYRLDLHDWWEEDEATQSLMIGSVVLNTSAKLDQWEEKAGLFAEYIEADRTPDYDKSAVIDSKSMIDITDKLSPDGVLNWDVPSGNWVVMRFSYVPVGALTKHGRANLIGRECDKLSVKAAEIQWKNYVERILDSLTLTKSGQVSGIAMDSHEAGAQNWTDNFIEEFKSRRGYDPTLYLPVMAGYIVDGVKESDGFLFDVRRNIADMISDNYYGTFERLAESRGLNFTAQAIGNALCIAGDPIQAKSKVRKPQGEFWAIQPDGNYDIKESSSAAHLYGKKIASAEAYTDATYAASLSDLKSLADYAYAFGINEFVVCASAYQPWLDKIPGSTGGGRQYVVNRNNTWWNYSRPFWNFQARSAYIMRAGKAYADLCIYLGENPPVKILTYRLPKIPPGFDFDAFTTDALLKRMEGEEGKIVLPDGLSYRMMILPRNGSITLGALKKIASIVEKGANVYGAKPTGSGSAKDIGKEAEYKQLTDKLWGPNELRTEFNKVGKGKVYWGENLEDALKEIGAVPDLAVERGDLKSSKIYFAHRKLADADVYFLDNHKDTAESNIFKFSVRGKYVQLWNPVSGGRFALPVIKTTGNNISVRLDMAARESYFVIITDKYEKLPLVPSPAPTAKSEVIKGPWTVEFDKKLGGPGCVTFMELEDWTKNTDPRIKYYSGTAVYRKTIFIGSLKDKISIELGNCGSVANVFINGRDVGIIWCSPWELNITQYLKKGENNLEIRLANSLMNRMILDSKLPEKDRITYAYPVIAGPNDALIPSGLTSVRLLRR